MPDEDSAEALRLIRSVELRNGGDAPEVRVPAFSDKGNAERLAMAHGQELRYCTDWGKWLIWDGARWDMDKTGHVMRRAKLIAHGIADEKVLGMEFKDLASHSLRSQSLRGLQAMITLASSELPIPVVAEQLDSDPWLLNCTNGTIDLQTGEFRKARREDLLTKQTPVVYDAGAECPTWITFLHRILNDDEELMKFVQRGVGYSLTAKTTERAIFLLYGKGRNGKSTFLETIRALIGDYAMRTPTETLLQKDRGAIPNDIARLKGARFVIASETDEGKTLAASKLKELAGGDMVSARFLRAEYFEFMPTFKIWIGTNHKPTVRDSSQAIWDRIKLIPFAIRIPDGEQDPHLIDELKTELPGILNWALAGCREWVATGLGIAASVTVATNEYRAEQDQIGNFLAECCILTHVAFVSKSELYGAYKRWCEDSQEFVIRKKTFGQRLADREFEEDRSGLERRWRGIALLSTLSTGNTPTEEQARTESECVAGESDLFKS